MLTGLAEVFGDAVAAAWAVVCDQVRRLVRDKGYQVAASSGAEHELDYYTASYWWESALEARARRRRWEDWWTGDR